MAVYFSAVWALAIGYFKRTLRDKTALFFTFLFPVMFLLVFGALYRTNDGINFEVALVNHSKTAFATEFVGQLKKNETLKIDPTIQTLSDARQKMGEGELDSILEVPEDFGDPNPQQLPSGKLIVYYEQSNPQSGQTLAAIMRGVFEDINKDITQTTPPLAVEERSATTSSLTAFDYVFAGLLGFSLLSLGIFGMANNFPAEKKTGSFRRLRVAPITSAQLILANILNYLVVGLLSVGLMVAVGIFIFDFTMKGSYFDFALFTTFGIVLMFGFGLAIGGWAKNENQSAPLSNLIGFPMMFLSGAFFPRFLMPDWLQSITGYLPLSPIVDGLRAIIAEGRGVTSLGPELLLMAVWTVVIYVLAIKLFRWE